MIDDDKMLRARDDELAEDCATIDKALDRKLRAELGVAEWERLMIAFFVPYDDAQTPEQEDAMAQEEAAMIAGRLHQPVAIFDIDADSVVAFARPRKSS